MTGTGLTYLDENEYEALPKNPRYRAFLPERYSLPNFFPTPGDQGSQGSCVGWAVAYGARSFYEGVADGGRLSERDAFSPAYVFNQIRAKTPSCDTGTLISDALNLLTQQGVARLSEFPYTPERCDRLPSALHQKSASRFKIFGWSTIRRGDLDGVKGALFRGHPVIVGMDVTKQFSRLRGNNIYTDAKGTPDGGHAMVIVGYDDRLRSFKLFNSWGEDWGDGGFGWVSYDVMQVAGREFYQMNLPPWSPPQPIVPPTPVSPPKPTAVVIKERILEILRQLQCGKFQAEVREDGSALIKGFSGNPDLFQRVTREISNVQGVSSVRFEVKPEPWPRCEVLMTLSLASVNNSDIKIEVISPETPVVKLGDQIAFDITLPDRAGFSYVHYLQANGEAVPLAVGIAHSPSEKISLGQFNQKFIVAPPLGEEMLVVISSRKPLPIDLERINNDRSYLSELRQAILRVPPGERMQVVSETLAILTTE